MNEAEYKMQMQGTESERKENSRCKFRRLRQRYSNSDAKAPEAPQMGFSQRIVYGSLTDFHWAHLIAVGYYLETQKYTPTRNMAWLKQNLGQLGRFIAYTGGNLGHHGFGAAAEHIMDLTRRDDLKNSGNEQQWKDVLESFGPLPTFLVVWVYIRISHFVKDTGAISWVISEIILKAIHMCHLSNSGVQLASALKTRASNLMWQREQTRERARDMLKVNKSAGHNAKVVAKGRRIADLLNDEGSGTRFNEGHNRKMEETGDTGEVYLDIRRDYNRRREGLIPAGILPVVG
ncbi:hypothetical protein FB451DRAFT_1177852 [Mycena latifolia]|nr:hypothetical protein FB451DRAFT_1177852 [Mycena latifolia]